LVPREPACQPTARRRIQVRAASLPPPVDRRQSGLAAIIEARNFGAWRLVRKSTQRYDAKGRASSSVALGTILLRAGAGYFALVRSGNASGPVGSWRACTQAGRLGRALRCGRHIEPIIALRCEQLGLREGRSAESDRANEKQDTERRFHHFSSSPPPSLIQPEILAILRPLRPSMPIFKHNL